MTKTDDVTIPQAPLPPAVPAVVLRLAAGRPIRWVWENELGGQTFRIGEGPGAAYLKWLPPHPEFDVVAEAARLRWVDGRVPVPRVLDHGEDGPHSWLLTAALPGTSSVDRRWQAEPLLAARAIGTGLRLLHDRLPVRDCPFSWQPPDRTTDDTLLAQTPPVDRLVVCHGDACAPNTLLAEDGSYCGTVDLGRMGVADRWADLAVAGDSLDWNFAAGGRFAPRDATVTGTELEAALLDAYGIDPDPVRTAYYRLLWDNED